METAGDAPSDVPQDPGQPALPGGRWPHLIEELGRLAGGSAADGPFGLLAVEAERLAADRRLAVDEET